MLGLRVLTAVVLLALLLPALLASSPWPFALLTLALVGAAGWEWGRLNGSGHGAAVLLGAAVVGGGLAVLMSGRSAPAGLWWLAMLLWVLGGAAVLAGGSGAWGRWPRAARLAVGLAVLWLAWLALASAKGLGVNFLLSVLALVWVADIAAYFGGRAFGRRKLAPAISPGKSWEGVGCGMAGVLVLALAWIAIDRQFAPASLSLYSVLLERLGALGLLVALAFLAGLSVVGDLVESLVKRSAGAKDSSRLLPGHGGVLDRIDALLPVVPLALALAAL